MITATDEVMYNGKRFFSRTMELMKLEAKSLLMSVAKKGAGAVVATFLAFLTIAWLSAALFFVLVPYMSMALIALILGALFFGATFVTYRYVKTKDIKVSDETRHAMGFSSAREAGKQDQLLNPDTPDKPQDKATLIHEVEEARHDLVESSKDLKHRAVDAINPVRVIGSQTAKHPLAFVAGSFALGLLVASRNFSTKTATHFNY